MKEVEDRSIHLIVTSPPYWQLKDYGEEKQIGFNDTYEAYINNLNLVWMECNRVLHQGCRLCVNIGDQFARSVYYGRYKIIPIRTEIIKFCETIGFDYMGAVIWQKVTTCNTTGGATIMGSFPYPRNGILKIDYEFILIFKKYGGAPSVSTAAKEQSRLTTEEWNLYFNGHWNFPGEKQDKHLAMFPEELPRRLIRMFSFKGDAVLDPFLGSGTTSLAARNLGRNSIGYEINPAFIPIIKDKLRINQSKIFEPANYEIIHQEDTPIEFDERIRSLPYTFRDPIKFDKKVDPKKMSFGSRIDDNPKEREDLFAVEKIISPEIMILDNGLKIKLLGIKAINDRIEKAIDYLRAKTKGQKIFLRFDSIKYDKENNLLCYVYLKNRLFLNAHLIKAGLAEVETSYDFKYKIKFENERRELSA